MARRNRPKPKTPAEIAADKLRARSLDLQAVNMPDDAAQLPNHADVQITRAGAQSGTHKAATDKAQRLDAFEALRARFVTGGYDAVRRLEQTMLKQYGEGDKGRNLDRVDGMNTGEATAIFNRVDAGTQVLWVLRHTGDRSSKLLNELLRPQEQRPSWRAHVEAITHEKHEHAQAAAVREAVANLVAAYRLWDELAAKVKKPRRDAWGGTERAA